MIHMPVVFTRSPPVRADTTRHDDEKRETTFPESLLLERDIEFALNFPLSSTSERGT